MYDIAICVYILLKTDTMANPKLFLILALVVVMALTNIEAAAHDYADMGKYMYRSTGRS
jgi:hypothetical protein